MNTDLLDFEMRLTCWKCYDDNTTNPDNTYRPVHPRDG